MSKTFKTPKGTELPLMNLKGKDYLQVAHRLVWFREEEPQSGIETHFHTLNEEYAVAQARILRDGKVVAMATKRESKKDFPDFIEKAETGAIGRALALLGYGTQFTAVELDEGARLADAPLEAPKAKPTSSSPFTSTLTNASPSSVSSVDSAPKSNGFAKPVKKSSLAAPVEAAAKPVSKGAWS